MGKWNNFIVQRMGYSTGTTPYPVYESVSQWGIFCKSIPFKIMEKVKEPAKRTWYDENGDDEYIPSGGLYLDAYTMKVEFACKKIGASNVFDSAEVADVRQKVGLFLSYLKTAGMIKLYSTYTRIGRQNVRLDSVADDAKWKNDGGQEYLVFSVTFKVNDPVTDVTLIPPSSSSSH